MISLPMQEELALTYEMLGVNDEALVQYDELDALFTQFVLNSNVTGERREDTQYTLCEFVISPHNPV